MNFNSKEKKKECQPKGKNLCKRKKKAIYRDKRNVCFEENA
jgi:hypothetical protein